MKKKILLKIIIEFLNYVNTAQGLVTHLHNRIYPQSKNCLLIASLSVRINSLQRVVNFKFKKIDLI